MNLLPNIRQLFTQMLNRGSKIQLDELEQLLKQHLGLLSLSDREQQQLTQWYNQVYHLHFLNPYLQQPELREIMIQGESLIQLDCGKGLINYPLDGIEREDLILSMERLAQQSGINWSFHSPFASFQITLQQSTFRATMLHQAVTADRSPRLYLRHIESTLFTPQEFKVPHELWQKICTWIKQKKNILISGASGSGKSSFVRMLLKVVPPNEHLVILEDTVELASMDKSRTNLIADGEQKSKSLSDLCGYALRMRPDRIIVGELRGKEITPLLLALNTGHRGMLSTIHADSAADSIQRATLLFALHTADQKINHATITKLICKNIDLVIHLKDCHITQVINLIGSEGVTPYYQERYSVTSDQPNKNS
ncbi:MAG: Flp pilus assembly complex ATPase component TadA [Bdellovibrionales bacterium]|jgi:type IV secretion system protein VirB11|nr:Flp pilus assembly complex ATPase component TadA [Bdellovibrionales bacterium]MBT3524726.1 Flp pilus assembly complex ATPase component TadA [Bdellovibrionales bacterium]MBT7766935.1 Flp pilus assembly complex ATPase component TadA [Bdellovibrionales bacterium]